MHKPEMRLAIIVILLAVAIAFSAGASVAFLYQTRNQVEHAHGEVARIKKVLVTEKVCSDTNRGPPCRALYERVQRDMSLKQRKQRACDVARILNLHTEDRCPNQNG